MKARKPSATVLPSTKMLIISNDGFIITKCHLTQKICLSWADFYLFITQAFLFFQGTLYFSIKLFLRKFICLRQPNLGVTAKKRHCLLPECCKLVSFLLLCIFLRLETRKIATQRNRLRNWESFSLFPLYTVYNRVHFLFILSKRRRRLAAKARAASRLL